LRAKLSMISSIRPQAGSNDKIGRRQLGPFGVPVGIVADLLDQAGTQRVGHYIAGDILYVFFGSYGVIIIPLHPESAISPKKSIECNGAAGLQAVDYFGKRGFIELNQDVQMIWHQNPTKALRIAKCAWLNQNFAHEVSRCVVRKPGCSRTGIGRNEINPAGLGISSAAQCLGSRGRTIVHAVMLACDRRGCCTNNPLVL
jgi:hypothetical protein